MRQLDGLKEQLAYLRLWLGILVVAAISLVGWIISAVESAPPRLWLLGIIGIMFLGFAVLLLHQQIERGIEQIRSL
jgi:hypothetical protein